MENRKFLKPFIFILAGAGFFIFSNLPVLAYGYDVHAALTQSAIDFYNKNYPNRKINSDLTAYLIDGSRREDDTPRWMNHFYDPIHNRGLTYDPAIRPDTPIPGAWDNSKEWAVSEKDQNGGRYKVGETIGSILTAFQSGQLNNISSQTNFAWRQAIRLYVSGKKEESMFALGHILHLMEDMTVPAHVRNDPHPDGDSYELYADRFSYSYQDKGLPGRLVGKAPISLANLGNYFDSLANYTNTHFYSEHTIGIQSGYSLPDMSNVGNLSNDEIGSLYFVNSTDEGGNKYYLVSKAFSGMIVLAPASSLSVDKPPINQSYWNILSVKSVQYSAGVINLFLNEAEAAEKSGNVSGDSTGGKSFIASVFDVFSKFGQAAKTAAKSALSEIFSVNGTGNLAGTVNLNDSTGTAPKNKTDTTPSPSAPPPNLSITESMYNPPGGDAGHEWIEVFNNGASAVDLADLKFQTGGVGHRLTNKNNDEKLEPGGYGIISNDAETFKNDYPDYRGLIWASSFSLNNSGDTLALLFDGNTIAKVSYNSDSGANSDGNSLQLIGGKWLASLPTPGEANKFINKATSESVPTVEIKNSTIIENPQPDNKKAIASQSTSSPVAPKIDDESKANISCAFVTTQPPSHANLIINELSWMGDARSANNEWLELKNISNRSINLTGWRILNDTGKINISLSGGVQPGGYLLLERTDDDSVLGVRADGIYSGALPNSGGSLRLFDNNCGLIDEIRANSGWPAGDGVTKRTMERDDSGSGWHTSTAVGGTPRAANDQAFIQSYSGGGGGVTSNQNENQVPASNDNVVSSSPIVYPKILITEIQLASASSTKDEFAEIYNPNDEPVDLTGWYLEKKTKSAADFSTFAKADLFSGRSLDPHRFLVIANPEGNVTPDISSVYGLADNNTLVIKNPNHEVVDKVGWGEALDYAGSAAAPNPSPGRSISRKWDSLVFENTGDNLANFEIKICPSPGEVLASNCLAEATSSPDVVQVTSTPVLALEATYDTLNVKAALAWRWLDASSSVEVRAPTSTDPIIYEISQSASRATSTEKMDWVSVSLEATTTSQSLTLPLNEIGRGYGFGMRAVADGVEVGTATSTLVAPSRLDNLYFYGDPTKSGSALVDINNSDPVAGLADLVVFYLNSDPNETSTIIADGSTSNVSQLGSLALKYQPCSSPNSTNETYFYSAPIIIFGRGDCSVGPASSDLSPDQLEDPTHLKLLTSAVSADLGLSTSSYLTAAYYKSASGGIFSPRTFSFLVADETKFYFHDYSLAEVNGFHKPPPGLANLSSSQNQNQSGDYFLFNWDKSTDPDSIDALINYKIQISLADSSSTGALGKLETGNASDPEVNIKSGEAVGVFLNNVNADPINNRPQFYPAANGEYLISLVSCDEFDNCSAPATTTVRVSVPTVVASTAEGSQEMYLRPNNYWGKLAQGFNLAATTTLTDVSFVLSNCGPISCPSAGAIDVKISIVPSLSTSTGPIYEKTISADEIFKRDLTDSYRTLGKINLSLPGDVTLPAGDYYLLIEPKPTASQTVWEVRTYDGSGYADGSLSAFDGANWQVIPDKDLYFELKGI